MITWTCPKCGNCGDPKWVAYLGGGVMEVDCPRCGFWWWDDGCPEWRDLPIDDAEEATK
jgi:hypothetical protein